MHHLVTCKRFDCSCGSSEDTEATAENNTVVASINKLESDNQEIHARGRAHSLKGQITM